LLLLNCTGAGCGSIAGAGWSAGGWAGIGCWGCGGGGSTCSGSCKIPCMTMTNWYIPYKIVVNEIKTTSILSTKVNYKLVILLINCCGVCWNKTISPDSEFDNVVEFLPLYFRMSIHVPTTSAHKTVKEWLNWCYICGLNIMIIVFINLFINKFLYEFFLWKS